MSEIEGARETVFVTGATGFIGPALVRAALASGRRVRALTRSRDGAETLRRAGADAILGDLGDPGGDWVGAAREADTVVHLAQPQTFGGRLTGKRARRYAAERLALDSVLLNALTASAVRRVIYVAGTSYYGDLGSALRDESAEPNPRGWGPYLAPAIEAVERDLGRGPPVVMAFPGWVYGPGSWFAEYVLEPLAAGKPVIGVSGPARVTSAVHVDDCARALLHLSAAGETGRRYFIVDDAPVPSERLAELAAEALGVPLRGRRVPPFLCRMLLGRVVTESLTYENALSNARLRATGFVPRFPTCAEGVPDAVRSWLASRGAEAASRDGARTLSL